ncbi:MAG TPA: trypsin-like peptidase domain-containing protein, partial [Acidimicrobiales bacterium]
GTPSWLPPSGPAHHYEPPAPPVAGPPSQPPRHRGSVWGKVALAIGAAALGAAISIPVSSALRDDTTSSSPSTAATAPAPAAAPRTPLTPAAPPGADSGNGPGGSGSGGSSTDGSGAASNGSSSALDVGVVDIDTQLGFDSGRAAGTGMVISKDGEVLTNAHVISGATNIKATVVTTGKTYTATVLGSDTTRDIALLKLQDASNLETVALGDSSSVQTGDAITAVGNAGGVGGEPSVSPGQVTALNQSITVNDASNGDQGQLSELIQTDASLEPGDSGGPMYDANGKVIGINTAADAGRFRQGSQESYAIPIDTAESIADQIRSGKGSDTIQIGVKGFLGVQVATSADAGQSGALIDRVLDGTPAASAGLQQGDLITGVDGQNVDSNDALTAGLHGHHAGDKVKLTWTDPSGASHTATITLAEGPA